MLNALTIDVEDYFQVTAFERLVSRRHWDQFPSRVVANTRRMLHWLDCRGTRATFFVLGWVADRYPHLVREIARAGHEVGCHSFWHRRIHTLTPEEFRRDLTQARDVLQNIVAAPVVAFRAPSFSITRRSLWALEILSEEGFHYDSSIFPAYHDRYGIPDCEPYPHRIACPAGELLEFPPSVARFWKLNLPISGGGYFRLMPLAWTTHWLHKINRHEGHPFLFYIHPWEFDPDQPRPSGAGWSHWRHYVNLKSTESKFRLLLNEFRFGTVSDVLEQWFSDRPIERVAA